MPLCISKGQTLNITMPAQPVHLDADPVRVAQMITNLLNNANKFTERGGRIFLDVEVEGEEVRIKVRDEGVGIALENLAHVFEMFAQINKEPGGARGGLGIGLTLVRSLAAMHGGSVEVSSAGIGMGATFVLRLPLSR
jgi:signal transduction histidine kinase